MAMAIIFLQGVTAFAAETTTNIAGEPIDRSGQVTRIDIPNGDGTFRAIPHRKVATISPDMI